MATSLGFCILVTFSLSRFKEVRIEMNLCPDDSDLVTSEVPVVNQTQIISRIKRRSKYRYESEPG